MRYLNTLSIVINIVWYLLLIASGLLLLIMIYTAITSQTFEFSFLRIITEENTVNTTSHTLSNIIDLISLGLFTAGIYFFRKVLRKFKEVKVFEQTVIDNLSKAGKLVSFSAIVSLVGGLAMGLSGNGQLSHEYQHSIEINVFNSSMLFQLGIGLFFLVLAEVFANGKDLKEEIDLTV